MQRYLIFIAVLLVNNYEKDADGSPIIVISENPLASPTQEQIPDNDGARERLQSPSKSHVVQEMLEQCYNDYDVSKENQR